MHKKIIAVFLALPLFLTAVSLRAEAPADQPAIISVIEQQLQAFSEGNPQQAFSHAAPSIKSRFGNADYFMSMVRQGYDILIAPKSVEFLEIEQVEGRLIQRVRVIGQDGASRIALYEMQQQEDGSWKISGCYLTQDPDLAV